jgi:hypothetical protein
LKAETAAVPAMGISAPGRSSSNICSSASIHSEVSGGSSRIDNAFGEFLVHGMSLLQHLNVSDQALPRCNEALQDDVCLCFMGMCRANQAHGDFESTNINSDTPARFR